jgi:hypothetical protein
VYYEETLCIIVFNSGVATFELTTSVTFSAVITTAIARMMSYIDTSQASMLSDKLMEYSLIAAVVCMRGYSNIVTRSVSQDKYFAFCYLIIPGNGYIPDALPVPTAAVPCTAVESNLVPGPAVANTAALSHEDNHLQICNENYRYGILPEEG